VSSWRVLSRTIFAYCRAARDTASPKMSHVSLVVIGGVCMAVGGVTAECRGCDSNVCSKATVHASVLYLAHKYACF